ncbi:MAG: MFS transporter [Deltaproteobacteria bacterium]|nr:MFS transporter [Deltaproteobacteria bacterium]
MKLLPSERRLLFILAFLQFTHVLDFVIMMPLAPQLMRAFSMTPSQFGLNVSAYTWSASLFGFFGAFFIDRFDRKRALLTLYCGFIVGTALCAIAPTANFLLFARTLAGAFGGMMGATVFAIVGDLIPDERRGTAMGIVMASFSVASILGVPLGLYLANHFGWHLPFASIAVISCFVLVLCSIMLPSVSGHLKSGKAHNSVHQIKEILMQKRHYWSFLFIMMLFFAAFSIIPFIAAFMVSNVKLNEGDLPLIYLIGGSITFFSSPYFGRLADRYGKKKVFISVASASLIPIILLTNLPAVPLALAILVTTLFMMLTSGRFVPAMAILTASIEPYRRGGFLSLTTTVQNLAAGVAAYTGGLIIEKSTAGEILYFDRLGYVAAILTVLSLIVVFKIQEIKAGKSAFHSPDSPVPLQKSS